jgi:hypothetical protein
MTPDSLGWNNDRFGCCSNTLDSTLEDCSSLLVVVWFFRALAILDHIIKRWDLRPLIRRSFSRNLWQRQPEQDGFVDVVQPLMVPVTTSIRDNDASGT